MAVVSEAGRMGAASNPTVTMYGIFALRDGCTADGFRTAFDAFSQHLKETGFLESWRFLVREPHSGYDARPPDVGFLVEMTFRDADQAERCYAYVEEDREPLQTLHRNVNRQSVDTHFALYREV